MNVAPDYNAYSFSPTYIYWVENQAVRYENSTVCNTFLTKVLQQAYAWDDAHMRTWMGSSSPLAATYHDKIDTEATGWTKITKVTSIVPGDIIAVKYLDGSSVSGHVMIAEDAPFLRIATKPFIANTSQYEVDILDSTSSPHGTADTRVLANGTTDTGAGRGTIRIYADAAGAITGYTWSTSTGSAYYTPNLRHLVVGRLSPHSAQKTTGNGQPGNPGNPGGPGPLGGVDYTLDPEI